MEFLDLSYCHTGITADCIGTLQECHSRVNIKHVGAITIRDSHTHNLANSKSRVNKPDHIKLIILRTYFMNRDHQYNNSVFSLIDSLFSGSESVDETQARYYDIQR